MSDTIKHIDIVLIKKGRNPRMRFHREKLEDLAASIREHGLIQPIVLEPVGNGYELVAGERRLRAHELLGLTEINSIIRERTDHNGRERYISALVENIQREDMNPVEQAHAYQVLIDEYAMSVRDISKKIGKVEATIYNSLLLTKLEIEIQEMIEDGFWKDPRFVRGLLEIEDSKTRIALAERLFKNKVSLNGCLAAVGKAKKIIKEASKPARNTYRRGTPAFGFADEPVKPLRWDAMRQAGKVPEWELVVHSVQKTCKNCALRDIANEINCRDCPTVYLVRTLMEGAK